MVVEKMNMNEMYKVDKMKILFSFFVFVLMFTSMAYAGTFSGRVVDGASGAPLENVLVTPTPSTTSTEILEDTNQGQVISLSTSTDNYIVYSQIMDRIGIVESTDNRIQFYVFDNSGTFLGSDILDIGDSYTIPGTSDRIVYRTPTMGVNPYSDIHYIGGLKSINYDYMITLVNFVPGTPVLCNFNFYNMSESPMSLLTPWQGSPGDSIVIDGYTLTITSATAGPEIFQEFCVLEVIPPSGTVSSVEIFPIVDIYKTYTTGSELTDSNGNFQINYLDGNYIFTFSKSGYQDLHISAPVSSGTNYDYSSFFGNIKLYRLSTIPGSGDGSISGVVRESVTGDPIENALVEVYNGTDIVGSTLTNSAGTYSIPVSSGDYIVMASASGYSSNSVAAPTVNTANPGQRHVAAPDILLTSGASTAPLSGYVRNALTNDPIRSVSVRLTLPDGTLRTTTTNSYGYYTISVTKNTVLQRVEFRATGYTTKGFEPFYVGPSGQSLDVYLNEITTEGQVSGYVTNSVTGAPIINAQVTDGFTTAYTNNAGYYSINARSGSINLTYTALGYYQNEITVNVPAYGTITQNVELDPAPLGWVHGYVFRENGNPISGATVSISGTSTTTSADGSYNLSYTEGTWTVGASASGFNTRTTSLIITRDLGTEHNFTLQLTSSDDGGSSSGGSGSSGSGGSGTIPSGGGVTTTPPTTYTTSASSSEEGGLIIERKIVHINNQPSKVILTVRNTGESVGPFEIRERPPSYVNAKDIGGYTLTPYEVITTPLTIIWRFDGLASGGKIVFAYEIDGDYKTLHEKNFEANIYYLKASVPTPQIISEKVVITAPSKAFVGDTITVTLMEEDGKALANYPLIVVSPYRNTYTLTTDSEGKIRLTLELKGVYNYIVPDKEIVAEVSTEAVDRDASMPEVTDIGLVDVDLDDSQGFFETAMQIVGETFIVPLIILILVGGIIVIVIGAYVGYTLYPAPKKSDSKKETVVIETGKPKRPI